MSENKKRISLPEVIIFGLIGGALFGLFVEWNNYSLGNIYWANNPQNFPYPLSLTLFGTFPLAIFIGYMICGLFVSILIYYCSKKVHIG